MKQEQTFLPVFTGFYGTIFEPDEESAMCSINSERVSNGLERIDECEFDYDGYTDKASRECVYFIEEQLKELGLVEKIEFESLYSPREYNFSNDSINVLIDVNEDKVAEYINKHLLEFSKYLKRNYTSCSGFISRHSNMLSDWREDTENFTCYPDCHKLGAVLQFVCENEQITDMMMLDYCYFSDCNYNVKDFYFETTKIKCPVCGDWYTEKDLLENFKRQIEYDLKMSEGLFTIPPKTRSFEEWVRNIDYRHCVK